MDDESAFLNKVMDAMIIVKEIPISNEIEQTIAKFFSDLSLTVKLEATEKKLIFKVANYHEYDVPPKYQDSNRQQVHKELLKTIELKKEQSHLQMLHYLNGLNLESRTAKTKEDLELIKEKIKFFEEECIKYLNDSINGDESISYFQQNWEKYLEEYKRCPFCHKGFKTPKNRMVHVEKYHSMKPSIFERERRPY